MKKGPGGDDSARDPDNSVRTTAATIPRPYDIAGGLRRRREAARRLPVLRCGCRDPLEPAHLANACRWPARRSA